MTIENQNQQTVPDNDGWFYADDADKEMGIETKTYDNGQKMKRGTLSDGRKVMVKRLKGFDAQEIRRQLDGKSENYQGAVIARSTTINDQKIVIEDLNSLWLDDYTKIAAMSDINFPTTQNA